MPVSFEREAEKLIWNMMQHVPKGRLFITDEFSHGEVKMLEYLFMTGDGLTAGQLSEKLGVSTARTARMLKTLEGKGLIRRGADENDKRRVLVFLTEEGKRRGESKYKQMKEYFSELFRRLGEEDTLAALRLIERISKITRELCLKDM